MPERMLSYRETQTLLERYCIPLAPARLVQSPQAAVQAAGEIGYPAAVKVISPEQSHKSDAGLLALGLVDAPAVAAAAAGLLEKAAGLRTEGLLVQQMAPSGVEVLAGISRDAQFGPLVAFGAGGALVELLEDIALRLPPFSAWEAGRMLQETRVYRLLQGYRQHPPAHVERLAALLVALGRIALDEGDTLVSLDLNPVIVHPAGMGLSIVDARAVVSKEV